MISSSAYSFGTTEADRFTGVMAMFAPMSHSSVFDNTLWVWVKCGGDFQCNWAIPATVGLSAETSIMEVDEEQRCFQYQCLDILFKSIASYNSGATLSYFSFLINNPKHKCNNRFLCERNGCQNVVVYIQWCKRSFNRCMLYVYNTHYVC